MSLGESLQLGWDGFVGYRCLSATWVLTFHLVIGETEIHPRDAPKKLSVLLLFSIFYSEPEDLHITLQLQQAVEDAPLLLSSIRLQK